jgi:hypothetical protein
VSRSALPRRVLGPYDVRIVLASLFLAWAVLVIGR